jgi:hypothetical protein
MTRFQKLTRNLFFTLHGHNAHRQQRQLFKFLMCYQQFASHAYCVAAGPVFKMASHQCVYEVMWKIKSCRPTTNGNIIRRMRFARWITKATNTHSEYVILIAFPREKWLRETRLNITLYAYSLSFLFSSLVCCC